MKPEKIEEIRKRIKDEWLLIDVTKVNRYDEPLEGQLLAHTKDRDEIWQRFRENKGDLLSEIPKGKPFFSRFPHC